MPAGPRVIAVLVASWAAACDLPRDPRSTLEDARGGTLTVAVLHHPPWASVADGRVEGVEVELVERFADALDADVVWVPAGRGDAFAALERAQVDLVVGGIDRKEPWKRKVGLTRGFLTERICLGERPGADPSDPVYVRHGEPAARKLDRAELVAEIPADATRALAPDWELERLGLAPTGWCPREEERAWAVIPGENALLVALDRFLADHAELAHQRLVGGEE